MTWLLIGGALIVTLIAAMIEAYGYTYSFQAFKEPGQVHYHLLGLSFGIYAVGIIVDYCSLYILSKTHLFIPELLAMIFMVTTIVGIAILSGQFLTWKLIDQLVAGAVVAGLAWLTYSVGDGWCCV
jgi:hypothetical protein